MLVLSFNTKKENQGEGRRQCGKLYTIKNKKG
jgi:hypothetical protein